MNEITSEANFDSESLTFSSDYSPMHKALEVGLGLGAQEGHKVGTHILGTHRKPVSISLIIWCWAGEYLVLVTPRWQKPRLRL